MFANKRRLKHLCFISVFFALVAMIGLMVVFLTSPADAGADQYIKITNYVKYYDQFGSYCSNLSYTRRELTPVVYNGYGHYYNYHIMGQSGHTNHSWWIVGHRSINTTINVADCNT